MDSFNLATFSFVPQGTFVLRTKLIYMTNSCEKFTSAGRNLAGIARRKECVKQQNAMQTGFGVRESKKNGKQGTNKSLDKTPMEPLTNIEMKRNALNGRRYKELFKAKKTNAAGHVLGKESKLVKGDGTVTLTEAICPTEDVETVVEKPASSNEGQRMVPHPKKEACSSDAVQNHDISGVTPVRNKDALGALNGKLTSGQDHIHSLYQQDIQMENDHKRCTHCGDVGELLSCAGRGCGRSFHLRCVDPPFTYVPPGVWHCIWCVKRKMEFGVYCVSEGIESILDVEGMSDEETQQQYLVKYKGLAHVHSCWIARKKLLRRAPAVFLRYKKQKRVSRWKREWNEPQRLLAKRLLILPEQSNSSVQENDHCGYEWLVKWTGLGFNHATWELEDAPFLRTPEGIKLISDFAVRHKVKQEANHAEENKMCNFLGREGKLPYELTELPCGGPDHLNYVKKLLECWHRDQNALIIDAQERIVVVILFVLSLLKEMSGPFLIVTTSTSLPMWEAEFQRWATMINVVVYKGNGDTRDIIRTLEFYNKGGCIMFQVLLSPSNAVAEDLENLKPIKWEIIVIDDFQRRTISVHTEKIKMLAARMRLLVVSSQIKDWSINYLNALSLLDPNLERVDEDVLEEDGDIDTSEMKEKLVNFTAYERKREAVKLTEFWVPVMLSDVQNEQYCASLFSNSMLLCSYSRSDPAAFSVRDLLKTTRKCCDHPYLVDRSLSNLVLLGKPTSDHFDIEIQMSGKLQLLSKILPEIKRRGLRVVILFQAVDCSGEISMGDILDDFIREKFGTNAYSRIDGEISRSKKQATLDMFNSKENGNFVCLIETRACLPSTKLSSVDAIIIFNSDWDPVNDLKALQKITIESQFEQLKIFRLYSSDTVEEKALILAKEGLTVDSSIISMKQSTCQKLLTWGSSCLFRRLDDSYEFSASSSNSINSLEETISEDVIEELSALLPCSSVEKDSNCCSSRKNKSNNILSVQMIEGTYEGNNLYLIGELKAQSETNLSVDRELWDKPPPFFWRKLLAGRKPRWKYVSSPSGRIKRKVKLITTLSEESEGKAKAAKKSRMEANSNFNQTVKRKFVMEKGLRGGKNDKKRLSGIRRYRKVRKGADSVPFERAKEAAAPFRHHAGEVQKAASLYTMGMPMDVPRVQPGISTPECSPRPNVLLSSSGREDGDFSDSREGQCEHSNLVSASCCLQLTAPIEGSARPLCNSVQQAVRNLSPQPATTLFDRSEPDPANLVRENINPNFSNNHYSESSSGRSQVPLSACLASLQQEMERIQEAKEQAVKFHEDLKLHLESECEKEIGEVRKKYDLLLHNDEEVMAEKKSALESCYQITTKQILLAEAMVLKQHDIPAANAQGWKEGTLSTFMSDIYQFCSRLPTRTTISGPYPPPPPVEGNLSATQQYATCSPAIAEEESVEPHTAIGSPATSAEVANNTLAGQQIAGHAVLRSALPTRAPCSAVLQPGAGVTEERDQSSASLAMTEMPSGLPSNSRVRPPFIANIRLSGNLHSKRETRAPAPHLRNTLPCPANLDAASRARARARP